MASLVTVAITARFRDGPFGPFPGGPLERGLLVRGTLPEPETLARLREVELQLSRESTSRLTWVVEHEGELFIPCGYIGVPGFKRWPHEALADGRSILRMLGRRYAGRLERVTDADLYRAATEKVAAKYGGGLEEDPDSLWIFRFEPAKADDVAADSN